jgi:hypothetical protein
VPSPVARLHCTLLTVQFHSAFSVPSALAILIVCGARTSWMYCACCRCFVCPRCWSVVVEYAHTVLLRPCARHGSRLVCQAEPFERDVTLKIRFGSKIEHYSVTDSARTTPQCCLKCHFCLIRASRSRKTAMHLCIEQCHNRASRSRSEAPEHQVVKVQYLLTALSVSWWAGPSLNVL